VSAPGRANDAVTDDQALHDYLRHLAVERRLAARTLALYTDALARLQAHAQDAGVALREVQVHHVRRWAARLHAGGLAPRSIALVLAGWRGLYRWWGHRGEVALNPVDGVRAPRAAKPLPKALSVDHAVALAQHPGAGDGALAARDHCIVELLYGPTPAPMCWARAASGAACRSAARRSLRWTHGSRIGPAWRARARRRCS
jgi:integrase/recombinase XerC